MITDNQLNGGPARRRICVAVLALGGQGGGVLTDWIAHAARVNGYWVQATSVPGVAQRTGSTVYYLELVPRGNDPHAPVMALMPVPDDVDIVVSLELMEAGRAILRHFVSRKRTTLITSTHRVYAISEKAALDDRRAAAGRILDAAHDRAARFVGFDMEAAAANTGSTINAVMLGALAASGRLPFPAASFEAAIQASGKSVAANLRGFDAGQLLAREPATGIPRQAPSLSPPAPTTDRGRAFDARVRQSLPACTWATVLSGVQRLMDYQDAPYADLYLDRIASIAAVDPFADYRLTEAVGRQLALWMSYEDIIRVASLKLRSERLLGIRREVRAGDDQLVAVTEYMHPGPQELSDVLPPAIGRAFLNRPWLRRRLGPLFGPRHVEVTRLRWFVPLALTALLRPLRRRTLRYREENRAIDAWLAFIRDTAPTNAECALETAGARAIVKGYGDTMERTRGQFDTIMMQARRLAPASSAGDMIASLRRAALADDDGKAFDLEVARLQN